MKCRECREVDVGTTTGAGGLSRRDFIKVCSAAAVAMGLPAAMGPKIAEAATAKRLPVIWISGQECTGCTETLTRADHPDLAHLILDLISLDYSETLNSGAGYQAEEARMKSMKENKGGYVMVMEGSIPMKDGGIYCKIAGRPVKDIAAETAADAAAVIGIGSCAAWGGMPSATAVDMNNESPTGAVGIGEALKTMGVSKPVMNIPGCPPNGYNFLSAVLYFVTFGALPQLDDKGRPKFAYSRLIHENCERRPHFDAGRFATQFGDDGHRQGYCLYKLGCKGPETFNNCSTLTYNDVGASNWPVGMGAPCFGCSEEGVGFTAPLHSPARPLYVTPPALFADAKGGGGKGATAAAAAVAAGVVGAVVGAGVATSKGAGKKQEE